MSTNNDQILKIIRHKSRFGNFDKSLSILLDNYKTDMELSPLIFSSVFSGILIEKYSSKCIELLTLAFNDMIFHYNSFNIFFNNLIRPELKFKEMSSDWDQIPLGNEDEDKFKPIDSLKVPLWYYFIYSFKCGDNIQYPSDYNKWQKWDAIVNFFLHYMEHEFEMNIDDESLFWTCFMLKGTDILDTSFTLVSYAFCSYDDFPDISKLISINNSSSPCLIPFIPGTDPSWKTRWRFLNLIYSHLMRHSPNDIAPKFITKVSLLSSKCVIGNYKYNIIKDLQRNSNQ